MTLLHDRHPGLQVPDEQPSGLIERDPVKAGYGNCINCGCGAYVDNGTGDCRCGHSFGNHYS